MSRQENRTGYSRKTRRLALVALLGGLALGLANPRPLLAQGGSVCPVVVVERREVSISGGKADFGEEPHLLGQPRGAGSICWSGWMKVVGKLYWDAFEAGCAHISLDYYSAGSPTQRMRFVTHGVCSPGGLRWAQLPEPIVGSGTSPANTVRRLQIHLYTSRTANGRKTFLLERIYDF